MLTGASNVFATQHVADSLAGWLVTLTPWPLTIAETFHARPSVIRILNTFGGSPMKGRNVPAE